MADEKQPQPIQFQSREIEGAAKYFASAAWPESTQLKPEQLEGLPEGLVVIEGDNMTITAANGTAQYLKTDAAEDGALTFELLESTFEPVPEKTPDPDPDAQDGAEPKNDGADQAQDKTDPAPQPDLGDPSANVPLPGADDADTMVIDTRAEDEPVPEKRKTFGDVISAETRAAMKRGDMPAHAAIHNFEIAAGDFKRAAQALIPTLPENSEMRDILGSIVSDL